MDNDDSFDSMLQSTVIPNQVAQEVVPTLLPEKNGPTDEAFELAVSLKNGNEKLNYSEKELAFIKNCARLEKKYGKSMKTIEKSFSKLLTIMVLRTLRNY